MTRLPLALLAVTAVFAAGCGGDDDTSGSSGSTPATTTAAAETGGTAAKGDVTIEMKDIKFDPAQRTVAVGQTVVWRNAEDIPHNVTATDGADFKSDDFSKGGTFEYKAEKSGVVKYTCTLHPGMDGTLRITGSKGYSGASGG
jgi:plastocyanin